MMHPDIYENLVHDRQAELLADAARDARADAFLRSKRLSAVIRRPIRVVRVLARPLQRPTAA
jgi:hypothetical protein